MKNYFGFFFAYVKPMFDYAHTNFVKLGANMIVCMLFSLGYMRLSPISI